MAAVLLFGVFGVAWLTLPASPPPPPRPVPPLRQTSLPPPPPSRRYVEPPYIRLSSATNYGSDVPPALPKNVEVLGDRVKCDVRYQELKIPASEYQAFKRKCMGEAASAPAPQPRAQTTPTRPYGEVYNPGVPPAQARASPALQQQTPYGAVYGVPRQ
jgi:hypothetical protein